MSFSTFNLHRQLEENLVRLRFESPTPIQKEAIPAVMQGKDVMGIAQTGTGKTAAFGLPILDRIIRAGATKRVAKGLIIVPTRELAVQIRDAMQEYCSGTSVKITAVFGGTAIRPQSERLKKGCDVIVACPGRLLDHMSHGRVDLSQLEFLVLDEGDQMFDMGFLPTIKKIVKQLPLNRQTLLFSATMPDEIKELASELLGEPTTIRVGNSSPVETVSHALYPVGGSFKTPLLLKILGDLDSGSILIFTKTKHRAKRLGSDLEKKGHNAAALHGNLSQGKRQFVLDAFRKGRSRILVATDIAARGIDIAQVTHVINYDMPDTAESYTHRIGRTGRASRNGDAFSFVTKEDASIVRALERLLKKPIESRVIEGFGSDAFQADGDESSRRAASSRNRSKRPCRSSRRRRPFSAAGGRSRRPSHSRRSHDFAAASR